MIITLGEALVAIVPTAAVALDRTAALDVHVGGAELNFAVGVRRLGLAAAWIGRVGADPFGELVVRRLEAEGVATRWVLRDDARRTGVYFREWLNDGARRPYYYRSGSAATALSPADWPDAQLDGASWLHLSGITAALGDAPRQLVHHAIDWARERGVPVSFDPNHRRALWTASEARVVLRDIAARCDVLATSLEEASLLFAAEAPEECLEQAHELGIATAVIKLGEQGAIGSNGGATVVSPASSTGEVVDPVGAGDGFDAGLVATLVAGGDLADALEVANYVGARAVEEVGEHAYPTRDLLPAHLRDAAWAKALASTEESSREGESTP